MCIARTTALLLIIYRWGEVNDRSSRLYHFIMQPPHTLPELGEPPFLKRHIDPVIHPIAGEYQVGMRQRQYPGQPFVEIGTGKLAPGMPRFGKTGNRLAG